MKTYDIAVIGAGSGGLVAAEFAAGLGARVVLIESQLELGGECLHSGCVPSKALLHAAKEVYDTQTSAFITSTSSTVNFDAIKNHIQKSIKKIETDHDNDAFYQDKGVDVIHGKAVLKSPSVITINKQDIQAKKIIISTGSKPFAPDIPGLEDTPYITNESIFTVDTLPKSLVVIGGGPIGCELGQAYAMLGTNVTILQAGDRLLPREEPEVSALLLESFKKMGIKVIFNVAITSVSQSSEHIIIYHKSGEITTEQLLVATGRSPVIPGGLEELNIATTKRGITVNAALQTSLPSIYAIGDCNAGLQFTHSAAEQAVKAVQHALIGYVKKYNPKMVPWVTFTTPEIAHLGEYKQSLDSAGINYDVVRINYNEIDKAVTQNAEGFIEVLVNHKQKILGATLVGQNAGELLGQIIVLHHCELPITKLSSIIQPYPTYSIGLKQMAATQALQTFSSSLAAKLLKQYLKIRLH
ncbi:MAG: hypothetical protein NVSMB46_05830 [Candidatus Saccharimonadales bacterium]